MSIEGIDQVLNRWLFDPDFRDALAADPEATLESYDLDQDERARLSRMKGRRRSTERRPRVAILRGKRLAGKAGSI